MGNTPSFSNVVIRLTETQQGKGTGIGQTKAATANSSQAAASPFATTERKSCAYFKAKGRPGNKGLLE